MAEINERASVSVDCFSPTTSTAVSEEIQKLSENVSEKLSTFIDGQIESLKLLFSLKLIF